MTNLKFLSDPNQEVIVATNPKESLLVEPLSKNQDNNHNKNQDSKVWTIKDGWNREEA